MIRTPAERMIDLARLAFDENITAAEERVLISSADATKRDEASLPRPEPDWDGPVIRPALIEWLATSLEAVKLLSHSTLYVANVRFVEEVDLSTYKTQCTLNFSNCLFDKDLQMTGLSMDNLTIFDCTFLQSLRASLCVVTGSIFVNRCLLKGSLDLRSARIGSQMDLEGTTIHSHGESKTSLWLSNAAVGSDLYLSPGFCASGELNMSKVRVGGSVILTGAKLSSDTEALTLDGANIAVSASFTDGFEASGSVMIRGAKIGGWVAFNGAQLKHAGVALSLEATDVQAHVALSDGFTSSGKVSLDNIAVKGILNCNGCKLSNAGIAFSMRSAKISRGMTMEAKSECLGTIDLLNSEIVGDLRFADLTVNGGGAAMRLSGMTVTGNVWMNAGFESDGFIDISRTEISGGVYCSGARLTALQDCLSLQNSDVGDNVYLDGGFTASGAVTLASLTIRGMLACDGASFGSLSCRRLKAGELYWKSVKSPVQTMLDLSLARLQRLYDDRESWPSSGHLTASGLIVGEFVPVNGRDGWIKLQKTEEAVDPQLWMQVAKQLRDGGHTSQAKHLIFNFRTYQAKVRQGGRKPLSIRYLWDLTVAWIEESPIRIIYSVFVCVLLGTCVFWPLRAHFSQTSDSAYMSTHVPMGVSRPGAYPGFQPVLYSLENTLPIVRLGQDDKWAPDSRNTTPLTYRLLTGVRWFLILAGWAQGIVLAAALDARFRSQ